MEEDWITTIDPEGARQAFSTLQDRFDALEEYRRANVDFDRVAIKAAALGRMLRDSDLRARFASLPVAEFDIEQVDILEPAALAVWYVSLRLRDASVSSSAAMVPVELAGEATTVKQRMMLVLAYNLGEDGDVASKLDDIRSGTGHVDLAGDLMRLARLYEDHAAALGVDARHYRADDVETARRLAMSIHQILGDGLSGDREYWAEYRARAWTFLVNTYDEVSATGRWLLRNDDPDRRFPSLYAVGRRPRRSGGDGSVAPVVDDEPAQTAG